MDRPKNKTPRMAFIFALDSVILLGIAALTIRSGFEELGFAWFLFLWLLGSHAYLYCTNRNRDLPTDSKPP